MSPIWPSARAAGFSSGMKRSIIEISQCVQAADNSHIRIQSDKGASNSAVVSIQETVYIENNTADINQARPSVYHDAQTTIQGRH